MNAAKIGLLVLTAAAASACSGAPARKSADSVSWYCGQSVFLSPDGRLPYNKTDAALKREVLEDGALIRETFSRPGPALGTPPELTVLEFRRRAGSLVYDVNGSFTGTVSFKNRRLKAWTLDFKAGAGGSMTGSGKISPSGLRMERRLSGVIRPMLVKEELTAVSAAEYERRLREFRPPLGAE